jgi:hypothetical protein
MYLTSAKREEARPRVLLAPKIKALIDEVDG